MLILQDLRRATKKHSIRVTAVILCALCALFFSSAARAQTITNVTGTVTDPNGIPYANARMTVTLSIPGATVQVTNQQTCQSGGFGSQPCYIPISTTIGPLTLDATGSFALAIYSNSGIYTLQQGAVTTQWNFNITLSPGIPLPFGTGPQQFSVPITISGASQSISATLSAAAPNLTNFAGGSSGGPNVAAFYAAPKCAGIPNCTVIVPDDSTDNSTAFAAFAAAVNAAARKTVNTQPQPLTVVIAAGSYKYSSGLSFTEPVYIQCIGSVLDYSGTAHAIDLGPPGLTNSTLQSGAYTIDGCHAAGGATMTEGWFFNQFITTVRVLGNYLADFGNSSSARVWFDGDNWDTLVQGNTWIDDDNVRRGNTAFTHNIDANSQTRFVGNFAACLNGPTPTVGCTSPGPGFAGGGTGSQFTGNNMNFYAPNIIVPQIASATRMVNNYSEENVAAVAVPDVQFGSSTDTGMLDGLYVSGLYVNQHTNNSPFGPGSATMGLSNASINGVYVVGLGSAKVVTQNNVTGQVNNQSLSVTPFFTNTNGSNIAPWTSLDYNLSSNGLNILFTAALSPQPFTVATLPSAATAFAGTTLIVTDSATFTPGTCTGGGSDYMLAVSNGTTWTCH